MKRILFVLIVSLLVPARGPGRQFETATVVGTVKDSTRRRRARRPRSR